MDHFELNYKANLSALGKMDINLYQSLLKIEENSRFEAIPCEGNLFDIVDMQTQERFYTEPLSHTQKALRYFHPMREHTFLYLFGIGNGNLHKELLKNPKHVLTIIEPELELIFVALHCEDFSQEILEKRVFFLLADTIKFAPLVQFMNQDTRIYYARSFKLNVASTYYEHFYCEMMAEINRIFIDAIEYVIVNSGNHIEDALMGLEHHIYNIPHMVAGTQFKAFCKQKNTDTIVMVSTGPSLAKQLPLLKEIQNNVAIVCADSALRILYANEIVPDMCVSIERIKEVKGLFDDLPMEYKKKVIFVRASLEHKDVFETLDGCHDILVMRPHNYNTQFHLEPYGVLCSGTSVANMAHELCAMMRHKTCIIIGQDLAFGKNGVTHTKGHKAGDYDRADTSIEKVEIEAYGGKGMVTSHKIWQQFLNALVQTVHATQNTMSTINATEGGARIAGTIEMPFKKAVKKYIDLKTPKKPIIPKPTPKKEAKKYYKIASKRITLILKEGKKIQKELEKSFKILAKACKKMEHKTHEQQIKLFTQEETIGYLKLIEKTRGIFEENQIFKLFYWEIMQSIVVHMELALAEIKTTAVNSQEENQLKALKWIYNHSHYFYTLAGAIANTVFWMERGRRESIEELPEELKFLVEK
ncbi:MAG: DUF115 domain-containing protein [Sulfurospirillaceae bacterium]|nr:DUF115 domain-containing protein [Sulfurospirillaceae bacterium]